MTTTTPTLDQSFSARQVPWMKIGTVIDDPDVNAAEAARLGGIDFDVELQPAGRWRANEPLNAPTPDGDEDEPAVQLVDGQGRKLYRDHETGARTTAPGRWMHIPSRFAVVRQDTDDWFSVVSDDYRPVQYREAFEFMDKINPRYVAAGALSSGRQGFIIAQLPEHVAVNVEVNGVIDPHDTYVVLQTSHDLSKGITISIMMLRNKCMNMLTLPTFTADAPQQWMIRHVGDPAKKLEEAHRTLKRVGRYEEIFERMITQLASVRVTSDDLRHIARLVLPSRLVTRDQQVEAIVDRFERAETVGFHDTGWGAVNAVSDYMQWGRTTAVRTAQSEFTSPLSGDAAKYVSKVTQLVMNRA